MFHFRSRLATFLVAAAAAVGLPSGGWAADEDAPIVEADVSERVLDLESLEVSVVPINDFVSKIEGYGAVFLVNTSAGSVLIDTGFREQALAQKKIIEGLSTGPVRKIILTHAHADHASGLMHWQAEVEAGTTEVVAHHRFGYMARLQDEPALFFARRNRELYPNVVSVLDAWEEAGRIPPQDFLQLRPSKEVYPGANYVFELGGIEFVVIAPENGGEGEDGVLVWLPESRILFTGDLFGTLYPMFPNLYTIRGEKYRDPLDYIDALDLVLDLAPKVIAHSHFRVVKGEEYIQASVRRMRDAVQYVWDETIAGMNAGKSVWQLMESIELPDHLELSQGHGKVSWSVRAIWEIVSGWYHWDTVANLYPVSPAAIHDDLLELSGGPDALARRAQQRLAAGKVVEAIRLLDVASGAETRLVIETRIKALERLLATARAGLGNHSEISVLQVDLRRSRQALQKIETQ